MTEISQSSLDAIKTIGDAAAVAQLDGADNDRTTVLGALLHLIGATAATTISALGVIRETDYSAAIQAWTIQVPGASDTDPPTQRAPTLIELGKAQYLARIARLKLGLEAVTSTAAPPVAHAAPLPGTSSVTARKVKMNQILSQLDETEVDIVDGSEQIRMFGRYEVLYGKGQRPHPNQEPSIEQLSGLKSLLDNNQCPYADFAIFQPFAARIMKRLKFSGLILNKAGVLSQAEVYGPPDLDNWRACYDVWSNSMIMLDAVDLGPLQMYKSKIELLHARYGESRVWALLYQADTRARLEHMPRIRLKLHQQHVEAKALGTTTAYDEARPWNMAMQVMCNDDKFWGQEFVEPALIVLSEAKNVGAVTSDDAKVQGAKLAKEQASSAAALSAPPPEPTVRPRNPNRTGRIHDMVDGAYRSNRTGYQLCADFNAGTCTNTVQGSWCGSNNSLAHQCSRCLGTHSLQNCPHKESPKVGWLNSDRSKKGKGKGKKGKGRGGRAPY